MEEAPPGPRQAPRILDATIELNVRGSYARKDRVHAPVLSLAFIGDAKKDDRVVLQYSQAGKPLGSALDCAVEPPKPIFGEENRRMRYRGKIECYATPEQVSLPGPGTYELDLTYKLTAEGTESRWRHIAFEVDEYYDGPGARELMVSRDRELYRAVLQPTEPRRDPTRPCMGIATLDISLLVSPARTRKEPEPKVVVGRCYVNGRQVGGDQTDAANRGGYGVTDSNSGEVIEYLSILIQTNFFYLAPDQMKCLKDPEFASRAKLDNFLATYPGPWECKVTIDGKLARILRFVVDRNGQIPPHPEQVGEGALVFADPESRFVDVELVGDFDRKAAKRRLGGTGFFGRPWKSARLAAPPAAPPAP